MQGLNEWIHGKRLKPYEEHPVLAMLKTESTTDILTRICSQNIEMHP